LYRALDPLLGVFTGVLAFQLRQNHPRTAPPDDERLTSLLSWKYEIWKEERRRREAASEAEVWATLKKEGQAVSMSFVAVCHEDY
jgi:hypothetical protein